MRHATLEQREGKEAEEGEEMKINTDFLNGRTAIECAKLINALERSVHSHEIECDCFICELLESIDLRIIENRLGPKVAAAQDMLAVATTTAR